MELLRGTFSKCLVRHHWKSTYCALCFDGRLTGDYREYKENQLPVLLDVPLLTTATMFLQEDGTPPHFHRIVLDFDQNYPACMRGQYGPLVYTNFCP